MNKPIPPANEEVLHFADHVFEDGTVVVEMEIDTAVGLQNYIKKLEALVKDCVSYRDVQGYDEYVNIYRWLNDF